MAMVGVLKGLKGPYRYHGGCTRCSTRAPTPITRVPTTPPTAPLRSALVKTVTTLPVKNVNFLENTDKPGPGFARAVHIRQHGRSVTTRFINSLLVCDTEIHIGRDDFDSFVLYVVKTLGPLGQFLTVSLTLKVPKLTNE